jgi:hypothetical protein
MCRRSDGMVVALDQQENTHVPMERRMRAMNWVQVLFVHRIIPAVKMVELVK